MHFVRFSQQNSILSLYIINRFFFFCNRKECVYCAARIDSLPIIQFNFRLSRAKDGKLYVQARLSSWYRVWNCISYLFSVDWTRVL